MGQARTKSSGGTTAGQSGYTKAGAAVSTTTGNAHRVQGSRGTKTGNAVAGKVSDADGGKGLTQGRGSTGQGK